ncbi:MAG: cupin domain-containing protein, partial [Paracoccaceae bacterium]|nr:cupin domain-containing protein [Paracoccaceae bacterium]
LAASLDGPAVEHRLGPDLAAGELPQLIGPEGHWQMAATTGDWTLVGCTVSPGFQFEGFTLAEPGVDIPR